MLNQFTVKNYKSFKDEATLDMQAASISEHEDQIIKEKDNQNYLPLAVIYGPNGGGKSNILEAFYVLTTKILRPLYTSLDPDNIYISRNQIDIEPHLFSENKDKPTEFEIYFSTNEAEYRYILHINHDKVIYEKLDRKKFSTRKPSGLFERIEGNVQMKGELSKIKVSDDFSRHITLLSFLGVFMNHNPIIADVINWFSNRTLFLNYSDPFRELTLALAKSEQTKKLMLQMIQEMDLDIADFRIEEEDNKTKIYTKHIVNDVETELNLTKESSGTKKLFSLLPFVASALTEGKTLIVDELDSKLHPVLLKYIITLFSDMNINRNKAQLIFTSHDLSTMNSEVFRRDEIWFVAKGIEQNSQIYSLVEFKNDKGESVRKDAKFDKQYLEGKYGADPYLKKIINWEEAHG